MRADCCAGALPVSRVETVALHHSEEFTGGAAAEQMPVDKTNPTAAIHPPDVIVNSKVCVSCEAF
jgi:hypothetical protein